jgi:hypothetical protein
MCIIDSPVLIKDCSTAWIPVTAKTPALEGMEGSGVINFSNFIIRVVNFTILCLLGKRGK